MSIVTPKLLPMGDAPQRATAKETLWRLTALTYAHPVPEFHQALVDGSFYSAFNDAWSDVNGRIWPKPDINESFSDFEANYIAIFLHNSKGKPIVSIRAGDQEKLLQGLSRPVFMLNITNFYKNFGLKAATEAEGRHDEPDHLAALCEFMAVLCHLEANALAKGYDASPYRRAQRDFLSRFVQPFFARMSRLMVTSDSKVRDLFIVQFTEDLNHWSKLQIAELEAKVGSYIDPDAATKDTSNVSQENAVKQNLWG